MHVYYLFFLQNAGELRFIILRRKKGEETLYNTHHTIPNYKDLHTRLWEYRGDQN
jgi:hypothetical protein